MSKRKLLTPDEVAQRERQVGIPPLPGWVPTGVPDADSLELRILVGVAVAFFMGVVLLLIGIGNENVTERVCGFLLMLPAIVMAWALLVCCVYAFIHWLITGRRI